MKLTITRVSRKQIETKKGLATKLGIQTVEYGDKWLNAFENETNAGLKQGDVIDAVTEDTQWGTNFKMLGKVSGDTGQKIAREGMAKEAIEKQDEKWDKISWGKCKHAYLVELFKDLVQKSVEPSNEALKDCEQIAEQWADASMRKLEEQEDFSQIPF